VDKLVIDTLREHARVVTLLAKMERLRGFPLTPGVHTSLTKWLDCVLSVQDRRRKEVLGMPWPPPPALPPQAEDVLDLAGALADLARAARETRTTLWSALQATQLVELDREVATGLRKLEEDLSRHGEEIKDSWGEENKAEEIDTRGNADQETKKENPND
jgi:hypothetical protein